MAAHIRAASDPFRPSALQDGLSHEEPSSSIQDLYAQCSLDRENDEIRLLDISPGEWNEPIECTLRVASLNDGAQYNTLSYVWGAYAADSCVHINGRQLFVRSNLFAAMRRLRAHQVGRNLTIWIDALCINQRSLPERNHQVAIMGRIYSQSLEVLIWLGELQDSPSVDCVKLTLESLQNDEIGVHNETISEEDSEKPCEEEEDVPNIPTGIITQVALTLLRIADEKHFHEIVSPTFSRSERSKNSFDFVMSFLRDNDYFRRVWVIQELALAPLGSLYFGHVSLPLDCMYRALASWRAHIFWGCCSMNDVIQPARTIDNFLDNFNQMESVRKAVVAGGSHETLPEIRSYFRERHVSLDLDHVYGFLGLQSFGSLSPDYSLSPEEVFIQVSRYFLETFPHGIAWALSWAPLRNRYPNLPSWAIDWTYLETKDPLYCDKIWSIVSRLVKAYHDGALPETAFSQDNELILQGYTVDSIKTVGDSLRYNSFNDFAPVLTRVIHSWQEMVLAHHASDDPYPTADHSPSDYDYAIAWTKTLCANYFFNPHKAFKSQDHNIFQATKEQIASFNEEVLEPVPLQPRANPVPRPFENSENFQLGLSEHAGILNMVTLVSGRKRLFLTQTGYLGLANGDIQAEDSIYIVPGSRMPFILRPVNSQAGNHQNQQYTLVSTCYLEGFMQPSNKEPSTQLDELYII